MVLETVERIEPARLEDIPESIGDRVADLASVTAGLGAALNPRTAENLANLVRIMSAMLPTVLSG